METLEEDSTGSHTKSPNSSTEKCNCVPQQLIEARELLKLLSNKLEDCALERQATISHDQWNTFNSKSPGKSPANHFSLTRTYFANKDQDQAFQHLISCKEIFSECLINFIALLRGEDAVLSTKQTRDVECQWTNITEGDQDPNRITPESSKAKNDDNVIRSALNLRHTFADVIKAKVNFDTKFLGFEAVLHKAASGPPATDKFCVCQFTAGVAQNNKGKRTGVRTVNSNRKNTKKTKRLARSPRTLTKRRKKRKSDAPVADSGGDHSQIAVN